MKSRIFGQIEGIIFDFWVFLYDDRIHFNNKLLKIQNSIDNIHDDSFVISIFLNGRADVRRVIKPVQCNRITNYHAKLKTKATTQNGAPISKCKEKKRQFATSIRRCNRTRRMKGENEDFALRLYIAKIFIAAKQKI